MRRLAFVLLILLLPLRGWSGDAMAIQMVLQQGMAHAASGEPMQSAEHHDATAQAEHRHAAQAEDAGDCTDLQSTDSAARDSHCQTCTMCQACHSLAITMPASALPGAEPLNAVPSLAAQHFASADRAPGLKPPIS